MKKFVVLIFLLFFLSACAGSVNDHQDDSLTLRTGECIISPVSYQTYNVAGDLLAKEMEQIPPSSPWYVEATLPGFPEDGAGRYELQIFNDMHGSDTIWLTFASGDGNGTGKTGILIYNDNTDKFETLFTENVSISSWSMPNQLYEMPDGTLIGIRTESLPSSGKPVIMRFNEQSQRFVDIEDKNGVLTQIKKINSFAVDQKGKLWFITGSPHLYKFDIQTNITTIFDLTDSENGSLRDLTIGTNETIYLVNNYYRELIRFSLQTEEVVDTLRINLPLEVVQTEGYTYNETHFDQLGRLWVNNIGWMDTKGSWNAVVPHPSFYGFAREQQYDWLLPNIVFESTDKTLWFRSGNGITSLNQQGAWCWVTTYYSNLVEDNENNLWIIADGKLYKRSLN